MSNILVDKESRSDESRKRKGVERKRDKRRVQEFIFGSRRGTPQYMRPDIIVVDENHKRFCRPSAEKAIGEK
jgi:hypothetical protein